METVTKKLYEALFLVDSAEAASDWEGVNDSIKKVLDRSEAEIVSLRKWDERQLAYEVQGKMRGTYILVYFNVHGDQIAVIEREVQLSERIMRVLILRGDHLNEENMQQDTPAMLTEKQIEAAKEAEAVKEAEEAKKAEETKEAEEAKEAEAAKKAEVAKEVEAAEETVVDDKAETEAESPEAEVSPPVEEEPEAKADEPVEEPASEEIEGDEPKQE